MNVFVVEDSGIDYPLIENVFCPKDLPDKEKGYQLFWTKSKHEATRLLADKPPGFFDIGIIDIKLNEGDDGNRDGLDVAQIILGNDNIAFPLIIVTKNFKVEEYARETEQMGIDSRYFLSKSILVDNRFVFMRRIYDAIDNFKVREMTGEEYVAARDRKIGIIGIDNVRDFYRRNEILYVTSVTKIEHVEHFTNKTTGSIIVTANLKAIHSSYNIGHFKRRIRSNFRNFIGIDQSYLINLEMIKLVDGVRLVFQTNEQIKPDKYEKKLKYIELSGTAQTRLRHEHIFI